MCVDVFVWVSLYVCGLCGSVCMCVVCVYQVEELTAENTQLKERVALLEKLLDIKKQDEQLLNKMLDHVISL